MEAVDAANPGILDEPLQGTVAFRPLAPKQNGTNGTPQGTPQGTPRGQKRKPSVADGGSADSVMTCAAETGQIPDASPLVTVSTQ